MNQRLDKLVWSYDDHGDRHVAPAKLLAWCDYSYDMGDPRYQGSLVEVRLSDSELRPPANLPRPFIDAFDWLVKNDIHVHEAVISAIDNYLPTLQKQWERLRDKELNAITYVSDMKNKLNLAYVKIFPHQKDGLPYIGFDFDCIWDAESGFKVLLNGARVVGLQLDELSIKAVKSDGGKDH
ncbi:MAG: DUF6985 domain-containing protein [Arenimonas sp.]